MFDLICLKKDITTKPSLVFNWGDSTEAEHKAHKIAFTFFGAFTNV